MANRWRLITSLILILITCWFGYAYTEEINKISYNPKPFKQQLQRFIWLVVVGFLTYYAFSKNKKKWLPAIILIVYGTIIIALGILGLIESKYRFFSENQKELISGVRLFFSSPLPFTAIWFLSVLDLQSLNQQEK